MSLNKTGIFFLALTIITSCKTGRLTENTGNYDAPFKIIEHAQEYFGQKDYFKAIRLYKQLIEDYSAERDKYEKELAWATYEIGFCYLVMNRYDTAEPYFKKVIKDFFSHTAPVKLSEDRLREIEKRKGKK
ncbi:MAG: hypothetical protein A2096_09390 [Spirochaetes bacterium GWF1_41_5]|nr:MAG: hypothetical protein A2096_09390 [Spirochaetes bacterium GWF1_41_5]